ncbi:MAG: hypothetical protein M3357_02965 [Actinomycetota bacterium]|nr:hypothetical protein [Actinomycetota bacterium]
MQLPLDDLWSPDEMGPDLAALEGFPLPDGTVTIELTSGAGGRLERIVWRVESTQEVFEPSIGEDGTETSTRQMDSSVETTDVRFSRWDEPVDLTPPAPVDVDPTPGIDEKALARFDKFSVPVPRHLPDGFYLVSASVIDGEFYAGEDPLGIGAPVLCPTVNLSWGQTFEDLDLSDPAQLPVPHHLNLYASGTPCGGVVMMPPPGPGQTRPFVAGRHRGTIREEHLPGPDSGGGFRTVSLVVNGAQLEFSSTLTDEELSRILADLVPFDLAAQNIYRQEPPAG